VVLAGFAEAAAGSPRELDESFSSRALSGRLHFEVFLPDGYDRTRRRYPVVYVLHGLPAGVQTYRQSATFVADTLQAAKRQAIIVAPQGARDGDSDPEYQDWGAGRNWLVESWSGYFHATDPSGHHTLDLGSRAQNSTASSREPACGTCSVSTTAAISSRSGRAKRRTGSDSRSATWRSSSN
jgi:hypothetical protein